MLRERAQTGLPQPAFAKKIGLKLKTLQRVEKGSSVSAMTLSQLDIGLHWHEGEARATVDGTLAHPASSTTSTPAPITEAELAKYDEIRKDIESIPGIYERYGKQMAEDLARKISERLQLLRGQNRTEDQAADTRPEQQNTPPAPSQPTLQQPS